MNDKIKQIGAVLCVLLCAANVVAQSLGYDFGVSNDVIEACIAAAVSCALCVWPVWYNFNVTKEAKAGQRFTDLLKAAGFTAEQVGGLVVKVGELVDEERAAATLQD